MTCITGLTAQNTTGVIDIFPVTPEFVSTALDAVFADVGTDAVKLGMLTSMETIKAVTLKLIEYKATNIIVDPVMISTSGSKLLPDSAAQAYLTDMFPLATLITPNLGEAIFLNSLISGEMASVESLDDVKTLAKSLYQLGSKYVLVKGGHLPLNQDYQKATEQDAEKLVVDVLYDGTEFELIQSSYHVTKNSHGTGCTLSSAIAANLAKGQSISEAVTNGIDFVQGALSDGLQIGHGNGPINHLYKFALI
ncbi:pyridoxamine kinase [Lipomyces oligophaga]|uniref:pyridoxamine kinase n=1 Tax=Lipomyces oligophaga TaxID=45792 RepID=UPI0034CD10B3